MTVDNLGNNVGDVAGMGSDLFVSFAETTCTALVVGSSVGLSGGWDAMVFPVSVSTVGIIVCLRHCCTPGHASRAGEAK